MCEFCSFGPNTNNQDQDSSHPDFAGFFSASAIEAAVRHAQSLRVKGSQGLEEGVNDDDDDGT